MRAYPLTLLRPLLAVRLCVAFVLLVCCASARAQEADAPEGPFLVSLGSFSTKPAAQAHARLHGGWVLRSDLYRGLPPGYYASVLGPFHARTDAEEALAFVQPDLPDAFVRAAGEPALPRTLGDPALLAAVLGSLVVDVSRAPDGANPCAPGEPYLTVLVGFDQTQGTGDDAPAAAFWLVERTGEVLPALPCEE